MNKLPKISKDLPFLDDAMWARLNKISAFGDSIKPMSASSYTEYRKEYMQVPTPRETELDGLRTRIHELEMDKHIQLMAELAEIEKRNVNPSVQEAWEQYQIVLKLVG